MTDCNNHEKMNNTIITTTNNNSDKIQQQQTTSCHSKATNSNNDDSNATNSNDDDNTTKLHNIDISTILDDISPTTTPTIAKLMFSAPAEHYTKLATNIDDTFPFHIYNDEEEDLSISYPDVHYKNDSDTMEFQCGELYNDTIDTIDNCDQTTKFYTKT